MVPVALDYQSLCAASPREPAAAESVKSDFAWEMLGLICLVFFSTASCVLLLGMNLHRCLVPSSSWP